MNDKAGHWYVRRAAEILLFAAAVFIGSWGEPYSFSTTLRLVAWVIGTYGLALLYLPISGLTWIFVWKGNSYARALTDSVLFIVHGWVAMSVMYNGPWLIARPLDLGNSLIQGWIAVGGAHLLLLTFDIYGARYRRA